MESTNNWYYSYQFVLNSFVNMFQKYVYSNDERLRYFLWSCAFFNACFWIILAVFYFRELNEDCSRRIFQNFSPIVFYSTKIVKKFLIYFCTFFPKVFFKESRRFFYFCSHCRKKYFLAEIVQKVFEIQEQKCVKFFSKETVLCSCFFY